MELIELARESGLAIRLAGAAGAATGRGGVSLSLVEEEDEFTRPRRFIKCSGLGRAAVC
jgi:hypothetical protein